MLSGPEIRVKRVGGKQVQVCAPPPSPPVPDSVQEMKGLEASWEISGAIE